MTIRRTGHELDDRGDHGVVRETVVEERVEPVADTHMHASVDDSVGESEYVSEYRPWDFARGWLRFTQSIILFGLLLVETALAFRLVFALSASNAANGFVGFIYDVTGPLVAPFEGIASESASGDGVFEPQTLIAMAVWALAALIVIAFLNIVMSAPTPDERTVTRERRSHVDRTV